MRRALLAAMAFLPPFAAAAQQAAVVPLPTPAPGPVHIIGSQAGGCIAGAVRLPDTAPGLQTIRLSRSSFWGHPDLVATLLRLGATAEAAGLPDIYMGDMSNPRGGPLLGGHVSHQMGIDADIWLDVDPPHPVRPTADREAIDPPSLVRPDGRAVDPTRWRPAHITLLRIAAGLPNVDRILVNPAIKQQLCREAGADRAWLRLIRPWWGHASHMHLRLRCPAGQPDCPQAPPPPPGDGCDATLDWWFAQLDRPPSPPTPPKPPVILAACRPILGLPR